MHNLLCHLSVRHSSTSSDCQTRRRPREDDHLHAAEQFRCCRVDSRCVSTSRREHRHAFLGRIPRTTRARVLSAGGSHGACLCGEAFHTTIASPHHQQQGPLVLLVGSAATCNFGHHNAQHHEFRHHCVVHRDSCSHESCHNFRAVCHRTLCGQVLPCHHRDGPGNGPKEYRLRHMGVERMAPPTCRCGTRFLHPVAKCLQ